MTMAGSMFTYGIDWDSSPVGSYWDEVEASYGVRSSLPNFDDDFGFGQWSDLAKFDDSTSSDLDFTFGSTDVKRLLSNEEPKSTDQKPTGLADNTRLLSSDDLLDEFGDLISEVSATIGDWFPDTVFDDGSNSSAEKSLEAHSTSAPVYIPQTSILPQTSVFSQIISSTAQFVANPIFTSDISSSPEENVSSFYTAPHESLPINQNENLVTVILPDSFLEQSLCGGLYTVDSNSYLQAAVSDFQSVSAEDVETILSSDPSSPAEIDSEMMEDSMNSSLLENEQECEKIVIVYAAGKRSFPIADDFSDDLEAVASPYNPNEGIPERKRRKMQQNRDAALRYRQKKRAEQNIMYEECDRLEKRNRELIDKTGQIEREIGYLKELMSEVEKAKRSRT